MWNATARTTSTRPSLLTATPPAPPAPSTPALSMAPATLPGELPRRLVHETEKPVWWRALLGGGGDGGSAAVRAALLGAGFIPALVGCTTTGALTTAAPVSTTGHPTIAPKNASPEAKLAHYTRIVEKAGGTVVDGKTTVLALRGLDVDGRRHGTVAQGELTDTFVVMRRDAGGNARVTELRASTYPGQRRSTMSPDVDGDGVGDVGMIRAGRFRATPNGDHKGAPSFHVKTRGGSDRIPGIRDTNHDGVYSAAESERSARSGHTLGAILVHRTASDGSVSSIGCMNVSDYARFLQAVGGSSASFDFTLVDAGVASR